MSAAQKCRLCQCTETNACQTDQGNCFWVFDDLCSACFMAEARAGRLPGPDPQSLALMDRPVQMELNVTQIICLIGALQLALRHPSIKSRPSAEWLEGFTINLQDTIAVTGFLKVMTDMGWDQSFDVPAEVEERRIIHP